MANFNYCPLVWIFCNNQTKMKQEAIQKRALRFLYDDYESDYDHLLTKANKPTLEIRKLRTLSIEIFKTLNDLNPKYMKDIFTLNTRRSHIENKLMFIKNASIYVYLYIYRLNILFCVIRLFIP